MWPGPNVFWESRCSWGAGPEGAPKSDFKAIFSVFNSSSCVCVCIDTINNRRTELIRLNVVP